MKYMKLDQKGAVLAEYIWIDGSNGVRTKTKVRPFLRLAQHSPASARLVVLWQSAYREPATAILHYAICHLSRLAIRSRLVARALPWVAAAS